MARMDKSVNTKKGIIVILQRLGPLLQGIAAVAIVRNNLNLAHL